MPLAFIAHKVYSYWGVFTGIGMFEALGIAAMAAGLTVLFGNKKKKIAVNRNRRYINNNGACMNGGAPGQPGRGIFGGEPEVRVEQVDIYIPPFYRFRMKQDKGFGSINMFGNCSTDPDAPLIDADIDNGMGKVNIYFG